MYFKTATFLLTLQVASTLENLVKLHKSGNHLFTWVLLEF